MASAEAREMSLRVPVPRIISAAGFVTSLGGGQLSIAAARGMATAAGATWRMDELQDWASAEIAAATGAEAGWVTAGAAGGLTLAAAACVAKADRRVMDALPATDLAPASEVIVQASHRNSYDRALRNAGVQIVDVGYPHLEGMGRTYEWQLEAALGAKAAAIGYLAAAESDGIPLSRVCEIAHRHRLPVIVDAAAELPPADNLRLFVAEGADIVAFSGGKALRGPQASGILAGRRELIASVRLQALDMDVDSVEWRAREGTEPPHHGLGRAMKVGKEEIVGVVAALRDFQERDHDAERQELTRWLDELAAGAAHEIAAEVTSHGHYYPRLVLSAEPSLVRDWSRALAAQSPPILVPHEPLLRGELIVCPEAIAADDRAVVQEKLWARAPRATRVMGQTQPAGEHSHPPA